MRVTPHHTAEQLATLIRAEPRAKVARRLAAVRLALLGHTAPDIAAQVLLSDRQVRTWVARYNAGGAEALADRPGRGRKGPLTAAQEQGLTERLRAGPTPADDACTLRGQDVRRILAEEFGVLRSLQERGLIEVVGRSEALGRPLLYGTTPRMLELLGLRDLQDLPRADELTIALQPHRPERDGEDDAAAYVAAEH